MMCVMFGTDGSMRYYALCGTESAYDATGRAGDRAARRVPPLQSRPVQVSTEIAYGAYCDSRMVPLIWRTEIAYGAASLGTPYAMSGTELEYGDIGLRACYAMSGTDLAYQDAVCRWHVMELRGVR
eukprot:3530882-Rhodomonas_salina.2